MLKVTKEKMLEYLSTQCVQGEELRFPVYVSFGQNRSLTSTAFDSIVVGYAALTNYDRLIVVQLDSLTGYARNVGTYALRELNSLKISKVLLMNAYSVKTVFLIDGEKYKLNFMVNKKVYRTDLDEQPDNMNGLLEELRKWQQNGEK